MNGGLTNRELIVQKFTGATGKEQLNKICLTTDSPYDGFKIYVSGTGNFSDFKEAKLSTLGTVNEDIRFTNSNGFNYTQYAGTYILTLEKPELITGSDFLVGIEYKRALTNDDVNITVESTETPIDDNKIYSYPARYQGQSYVLNLEENSNANLSYIRNFSNYTDVYDLGIGTVNFNIKAYTSVYTLKTLTNGLHTFDNITANSTIYDELLEVLSPNQTAKIFAAPNGALERYYANGVTYNGNSYNSSVVLYNTSQIVFGTPKPSTITLYARGYNGNNAGYKIFDKMNNNQISTGSVSSSISEISFSVGANASGAVAVEGTSDNGLEIFAIKVQ
ncbi:MAG: hypothetical protein IJ062_10675 [Firmicutes bacterium]|nr:hypothetical protein [Bacillota bacterium]